MLTPDFRSVRRPSAKSIATIALVALAATTALSIGDAALAQEASHQPAQAAKSAEFTPPSSDAISVPESLKLTSYNVAVGVRVTMMAAGKIRVEVTKSSGYPALDEAVKHACLKIKFKPAMQDGKAVDFVQRFSFHLANRG